MTGLCLVIVEEGNAGEGSSSRKELRRGKKQSCVVMFQEYKHDGSQGRIIWQVWCRNTPLTQQGCSNEIRMRSADTPISTAKDRFPHPPHPWLHLGLCVLSEGNHFLSKWHNLLRVSVLVKQHLWCPLRGQCSSCKLKARLTHCSQTWFQFIYMIYSRIIAQSGPVSPSSDPKLHKAWGSLELGQKLASSLWEF